jgi:hypothetical protein
LSANYWIRQTHRWVSVAFTVTVLANFIARGRGGEEPPAWLTYAPLAPLAFLFFTGVYLFVLPYTTRARSGRSTG